MEGAEEVFGDHITKPPPIVTPTVAPNTKKDNDNDSVATVQPSCVGICSALDLLEQGNEPGPPCITFSATELK